MNEINSNNSNESKNHDVNMVNEININNSNESKKSIIDLLEIGKFYKIIYSTSTSEYTVHYGFLLDKLKDFVVVDNKYHEKIIIAINNVIIISEAENAR